MQDQPPQPLSALLQEQESQPIREQLHGQVQPDLPEQPTEQRDVLLTSGAHRRAQRRERLRLRSQLSRPRSMPPPVAVTLDVDSRTVAAERPATWPRAQGIQHTRVAAPSLLQKRPLPLPKPHRPRVLEPLGRPATEWDWAEWTEHTTSDKEHRAIPFVDTSLDGAQAQEAWWEKRRNWEIRRLKELKELWDAELLPEIEYRDAIRLTLGLSSLGVAPVATTTAATAVEAGAATASKAEQRRNRQRNLYVVGSVSRAAADSQD